MVAQLDIPKVTQPVVIEHEGRPTHVVLSWREWRRIAELLDDLRAAESANNALTAWHAQGSPSFDLEEALRDAGLNRADLSE